MTSTLIALDREVVQNSFREWQAEQALLDAQLADSVAALDAYQSHLDSWQQELARERDELRQLRAAIDGSQAGAEVHPDALDPDERELIEARRKISSLTSALLARTEELRDLDHQRGDSHAELALARTREKELASALAAQRQQWEKEIAQLREELQRAAEVSPAGAGTNRGESERSSQRKSEPRTSASPVLGSVMEQFGKLRQQRSMNRPNNPKPR